MTVSEKHIDLAMEIANGRETLALTIAIERAYDKERALHAPDTALVRFADALAGKAIEGEGLK